MNGWAFVIGCFIIAIGIYNGFSRVAEEIDDLRDSVVDELTSRFPIEDEDKTDGN